MKDEIKKILKDGDEILVIYKDNSFESFDTLPINVLDYITNLQQENKDLKEGYCTVKVGLEEIEVLDKLKDYKSRIDKTVEIYKNRNTCKYKKERFMKDKSTSDLMYESLTGGDD